ncbi:hypothetical protein [Rhodopirellula bahusiensis]|uniref:Secreted protein n=1 Tax=Rhodopirellula bahusiensis TaxID=2014065 RepID=A0A2G1W6A4_9BACT|nr:hypothetical protein [Rhodopirellula bahusiensis]PHQ34562.1 hypothetical protein CEE69_14175 [Rhodopirellula bahusiensis]
MFSTLPTTDWIRSLAMVVAVLMLSATVASGQANEDDLETDSSSPAESGESDPGTDRVSFKSFRKAPMDPLKISEVFRAQEVLPSDIPPIEPGIGETDLDASESEEESDDERSQQIKIAELIAQLGAPEFAVREQATAELRELANDALPALRTAVIEHDDLEVRLRAENVAAGIVNSAVAGRIDSFLDGQPGSFEGWDVFQQILGDGPRLREVFVEMMLRHQDLAEALEVSTEARAESLRNVIARIQRRQLIESQLPSGADVIAMLLCFNDHDLKLSNIDEEALLRMLRMSVTAELLRDEQLAEPFRTLLAGWIQRCDRTSWPEVFWLSLQEDLERTLPLAERVLEQQDSRIDEVALSLQLVSRFGNESNIASLRRLLKDERAVTEVDFIGGKQTQAQVRDLAAATIMILKQQPLIEVGLNPNSLHPKIAFVPRELGFPTDDPEPRQKMLEALNELLDSNDDSAADASEGNESE